jgi:hypothetical protein
MLKSIGSKVSSRTWTGSVPPAVAGGCAARRPQKLHTLPLPRVVLTRSKCKPTLRKAWWGSAGQDYGSCLTSSVVDNQCLPKLHLQRGGTNVSHVETGG